MTFPPLLRTPAVRLLLVAYPALAGILPADGRPWLTVPLCLTALAAVGALWVRALPGLPAESGVPAARVGLAAAAGLITVPLVALTVHAIGHPVRPAPLVITCTVLVTVLGVAAVLRDHRALRRGLRSSAAGPHDHGAGSRDHRGHRAGRGIAARFGLPAQRRHDTEAGPSSSVSSSPPVSPSSGEPGSLSSGEPGSVSSGEPGLVSGRGSGAGATADGDLTGPGRGPVRTTVAVTVPLVLAVGVGGWAVRGYLAAPRPAEPGYLSVALNGWATAIDSPVTVPARGLVVPVRVTSAGLADTTSLLQLTVGGRVVASRPMTVAADSVRSLTVYVPALPADGRLRSVAISVGATSIGFYALGHADSRVSPDSAASAAVTGPGVGPHAPAAGSAGTPGFQSGAAGGGSRPVGPGVRPQGAASVTGPRVRPQGPSADGVGDGRGAGRPATVPRTRTHRTGPAADRSPADRTTPARTPGARPRPVAPHGARPADAVAVPGLRPDGGVSAPASRPDGGVTPGLGPDSGVTPGMGPDGGVIHGLWPDGGSAAPKADDDRTRKGGTKGGRAVAGPQRTADDGGSAWSAAHQGADDGRVACSGKRRAVFAGERTSC